MANLEYVIFILKFHYEDVVFWLMAYLFPKGEFLYELTVWVPFFVAIFKLFIDQLLIPPMTCGFIVVGGGGGGRIFSC